MARRGPRPDIDVVDICTPPQFHESIALAAIAAGKHIFCEKPIANYAGEACDARNAAIEIRTNLQPAPADGYSVLLERLAQNLVDNAIRYNLPEHGWVTVSTEEIDGDVGLTVENAGPIVPASEVPGLFEPFRRLPSSERLADSPTAAMARGAGIGLSIVRSVAHAHGGEVHASAREDGGLAGGGTNTCDVEGIATRPARLE